MKLHVAKMHQCRLRAESPQQPSSVSSAHTGVRYSLLCFLPAEDKLAHSSPHPVASTCGSSSKSSKAYASSLSLTPSAPSTAVKLAPSRVTSGVARLVSPTESALQAAPRTGAVICPRPRPLLVKCASVTGEWTFARASRYNVKTNYLPNPPPAAAQSLKAGCSGCLAGLCKTGWGLYCGISPTPVRVAATAAWTATLATAAAVASPTKAFSVRACRAAALLLPPLFLSVCCRETYAATPYAPLLSRSQSAILPVITIAALSWSGTPPPPIFRNQSGSLAARVQSQCARQHTHCEEARNTHNKNRTRRSGGMLPTLRRRGSYMSFPFESLTPFSSWTVGMIIPVSNCSRVQVDNKETGLTARSCLSSKMSRSSSRQCFSTEASADGEACEGFLCPLFFSKTSLRYAWCARGSAGSGTSAGYATCRTKSEPPSCANASLTRPLFALAASVPPGGTEAEAKTGETADVSADHFYDHFQQPSHPAFDRVWQEPIPEMQLHVAYYVHRRTGTRLISLAAAPQEKEKVFCVSFRTPVADSTGTPHILEHSVLSGSKKYPLKEPFAELLKGSLYSFLNAYTYAEHTTYPVASVNTKDFFNLASVYFDAVFQPRVQHDIDVFRQEGWRLEASFPENGSGIAEGKGAATGSEKQAADEGETGMLEEGKRGRERSIVASDKVTEAATARKASASDTGARDEQQLAKTVKLSYQGVVLNEMKGVYSQPSWLLYRLRMKTIFPSISAYSQDSGGNPEIIPLLTYEHFQSFFKRYYSLSNARIFFYGSDDVRRRLDFVDKNISELDEIQSRNDLADLASRIREQPAFKEPVRVRQPYPATTAEMEDYVTMTWVLDPAYQKDTKDAVVRSVDTKNAGIASRPLSATSRLALTVLDHLLMGTSAAPLYKALAASQLGKEVIGGGLAEYKHFTFSAGLKGIPQRSNSFAATSAGVAGVAFNQNAVERVEEIVLKTLEKCAREGFEADAVAAAMNTVEFRLREFNTGSFPKGLAIILQIISDWMVDRVSGLPAVRAAYNMNFQREEFACVRMLDKMSEDRIATKCTRKICCKEAIFFCWKDTHSDLKRRVAQGEPVFQQLIQVLFLDNPHRATVHLVADATLEKEIQQRDEEKIEQLRKRLTNEDVRQLVADTQALKAKQLAPDPPEALATIPTLKLSDVEEEEEIPTKTYSLAGGKAQVLLHNLPTAGILYADVALPLHFLDLEELQFLSLFARMLTQAGTSHMDEAKLANYIGKHTGGVQASVDIRTVAKEPLRVPDPYDSLGFLVVSGKVFSGRVEGKFHGLALTAGLFLWTSEIEENWTLAYHTDLVRYWRACILPVELTLREDGVYFTQICYKAVRSKVPELFDVIALVLCDADFSNSARGIEILKEIQASTEDSFINSGVLAALRIGASLTATGYVAEQRGGVPYAVFIRQQLEQAKHNWRPIQDKLEVMREKLLSVTKQRRARASHRENATAFINLTGDSETLERAVSLEDRGGRMLRQLAKALTASLPAGASASGDFDGHFKEPQTRENCELPAEKRAFLKEECDAVNLEPLEQVENLQGGVRILDTCDWARALQQEKGGLKNWSTAAEGFVVPTQVNYVYLGGRMLSPGERFYGHFSVVAEALSKNYIWDRVRVVGGAYGGSFSVDSSGTYVFRSYRDPQLLDTLSRYLEAAEGLEEFTDSLDERGLTRAILVVLRGLNQPLSNEQKGYTAFWRHVAGETREHRAQYRKEVVKTTRQDFRDFAARLQRLLLVQGSEELQGSGCISNVQRMMAVVGSDKMFEEARASGDTLFSGDKHDKGASFAPAPCPLRFKLLDVKKATTVGAVSVDDVSVSQ